MRFKNCVLVLRWNRLSHLPPALYETQVLSENHFPIVVVEFGRLKEELARVEKGFVRVRLSHAWVKWFPKKLHPALVLIDSFCKILFLVMREGKPKGIISHGLPEQCLALWLQVFLRIPVVCHVHEAYEPKELDTWNRYFFKVGTLMMKRALFLIFPERSRAKIYQEKYQIQRPIFIVPNCARRREEKTSSRAKLLMELGLPKDALLMGYLGGIGKYNALEEAVVALAEVNKAHLLIWGWGESAFVSHLKEVARQWGVEKQVHFLGELNEDKWERLAGCDISYCVYKPDLLRLKYAATASNKLMESIAVGVPVLTNQNADFRAIVETRRVGLCLSHISSNEVAKALSYFVSEEGLRKQMSENAFRCHQAEWNYEFQFEPALGAFEEAFLIKKRAHPSFRPKPTKPQLKLG